MDSLAAESQTDIVLKAELASAYEKVGDLQGNIDKPNLSDFVGAVSSFEKAQAIRQSLPAEADNRLRLAQNLKVVGSIRNRQNDVKGSIRDLEQAEIIFSALVSQAPDSFDLRIASIEAATEHAQIYSLNNQYAEAIPLFRKAVDALERIDPNQRKSRLLMVKVHAYFGNALSWDNQQAAAETEMAKALSISEKLGSEFPNDSEIRSVVLQAYNLASSIYEGIQNDLSLHLGRMALATAEKAVEADKLDSQATYNLARIFPDGNYIH